MSVKSYIEAMPKVELHVHLEGAVSKSAMLIIADQNEVAEGTKHFNNWVNLLDKPEYDRLDELIRVVSGWVRLPEDLTRMAYEVGTHLSKQNVRYAEVTVSPSLYPEMNLSLEQFFAAINDGRDRAQRAWGVEMAWILAIPRDEPRKADDYVRYATSATARRGNVVGVGLVGKENVQPLGQFERAFLNAEKKDLARVPHAGDVYGAEGIQKTITLLQPNRIDEAWGAADSQDVINELADKRIALDVSMARAVALKKIEDYAQYPLRKLYDDGVIVTISSDAPALFKTSLTEQYLKVVESLDFTVEELEEIALNAVRASFMEQSAKDALLTQFTVEYERLRAEHITPETT